MISSFHCYFYFTGVIRKFDWCDGSYDRSSVDNGYMFLRKYRLRGRGKGIALHVQRNRNASDLRIREKCHFEDM